MQPQRHPPRYNTISRNRRLHRSFSSPPRRYIVWPVDQELRRERTPCRLTSPIPRGTESRYGIVISGKQLEEQGRGERTAGPLARNLKRKTSFAKLHRQPRYLNSSTTDGFVPLHNQLVGPARPVNRFRSCTPPSCFNVLRSSFVPSSTRLQRIPGRHVTLLNCEIPSNGVATY